MAPFLADWTGACTGEAEVVVCPATPQDVAAIIKAAGKPGMPTIPQSGNTSVSGGSVS